MTRADADDGTPIGRYVLQELIARGGMGEVFRAVARGAGGFEKPVVIKRILPQLADQQGRLATMFVEEARVMSKLVHPNIVQILDFGAGERDDYFLVMELVDGVDLGRFAEARGREGLDVGLAAKIVAEVLRGLRHAHEMALDGDGRVVIHRDVSPGNVLLSRVGEVKVADFGVALVSDRRRADEPVTLAGKLGYMAPEQYRGEVVDPRADLFSTGVVLYRLLTGTVPFSGDTGSERQQAAAQGAFEPPSARRSGLSSGFDDVMRLALAPSPNDRFASARAMSDALAEACTTAGVVLADVDEIADAVAAVVEEGPRARPVMRLDRELGQLTRHDGAFTMQVTRGDAIGSVIGSGSMVGSVVGAEASAIVETGHAPTPVDPSSSVRDGHPDPAGPRRRVGTLAAVAGLALAAVAGFGLSRAVDGASTGAPPPETSAVLAPTETASRRDAPPNEPPPAPEMRPPDPSGAVPAPKAPSPVAPPVPVPPAPPPVACTGKVLLAGKGSWWVSGGPGRVQAPGQYEWPCGSYQLVGTSRADGHTASRSVTVTRGAMAATRFE